MHFRISETKVYIFIKNTNTGEKNWKKIPPPQKKTNKLTIKHRIDKTNKQTSMENVVLVNTRREYTLKEMGELQSPDFEQ